MRAQLSCMRMHTLSMRAHAEGMHTHTHPKPNPEMQNMVEVKL